MSSFDPTPGMYRLEAITYGEIHGRYFRNPDGSLCIVSLWAPIEGQGCCTRFLDGLPHDTTVEFDNVISRRLRGALRRRGFQDCTGYGDWIRYGQASTSIGNTNSAGA